MFSFEFPPPSEFIAYRDNFHNFYNFLASNMSILRDEYIIADNRRLMTEVWKNVMAVISMFYRIDHLPPEIFWN